MLELEPVSGASDLFDKVKINVRAVKASGTQEDLVRLLLIPDVSKTLPKGIRLQIWERKEKGKEGVLKNLLII